MVKSPVGHFAFHRKSGPPAGADRPLAEWRRREMAASCLCSLGTILASSHFIKIQTYFIKTPSYEA
jgi:hypothetical protein